MPAIIEFKVYPKARGKGLYWDLAVFKTITEFREYSASKAGEDAGNKDEGVAICIYRPDLMHKTKKKRLGWLYFCEKQLGLGTISHEVYHATSFYLYHKQPKLWDAQEPGAVNAILSKEYKDAEEAASWFHGNMIHQIWYELRKHYSAEWLDERTHNEFYKAEKWYLQQ